MASRPSYRPAMIAAPGNGPGGVLGEEATQREALLPRERVEDPADDRLVVSCRHGRPPSA